MKKVSLVLFFAVLSIGAAFAGDFERSMHAIGPKAILATGLGGFAVLIGVVLAYVAFSYGTYLLAKKYAPKVHPAWSWIPFAQAYPLVVSAGQSPWWVAAILLGHLIPVIGPIVVLGSIIYIYYSLSLKMKRGVGTTLLLVFFSVVMMPYLGLTAHNKSTTPAWILGVGAIIALFIGGGLGAAGIGRAVIGMNGQYDLMDRVRGKMMREINKDPEAQRQLQRLKEEFRENGGMMRIDQKADVTSTVQ